MPAWNGTSSVTPLTSGSDPYRLFVDSVADYAMYLLDTEGCVATWNIGAERLTNRPASEVLGRPFSETAAFDAADDRPARLLQTALAHGRHEEECRFSRRDGTTLWTLVTLTALHEAGRHVGFAVVLRDISERIRRENEMRAAESRLRTALEAGRMGAWRWDVRANRSLWNEQLFDLLGLTPQEGPVDTERFFERVHPEDLPALRTALDQAFAGRGRFEAEFRVLLPDHSVRWLCGVGELVASSHGEPLEMYGVNYDITERKTHEDALRQSARRFRSLMTATTNVVWTADPQGNVSVDMVGWREFSGMSEEASAGWGWLEAVHPEDRDAAGARWWAAVQHTQPYSSEYRMRRADGAWRHMLARAVPVYDDTGHVCEWVGLCVDDTERRQSEVALRSSEQRFRAFMDHTPAQVWITDEDGICRFVNAALARELRRPVDDVMGRAVTVVMDHEVVEAYLEGDRRVLATGLPLQEILAAPRRDGGVGRFLITKFPLGLSPDGRRQVGGVAIDVTERERALQVVEISESRLRTLVRALSHVVWFCDAHGAHAVSTPPWHEFTGLSEQEASGWGWIQAVHPDDRERVGNLWRQALDARQPFEVEYRIKRADGVWRHFAARGVPVFDGDGRVREWVGVCADVSDGRKLEQQFRQAQKMEAVGRLAGGVAHDFNNLLTIINGYADLLLQQWPRDHPERAMVAEIRQAGERASRLTRQLLVFSRQTDLEPRIIDLNGVITDAERMLRRLIGEDVHLSTHLAADSPRVRVDPGQLDQALMNLAVNARDAMPEGGYLTIETTEVDLSEALAPVFGDCHAGRYALLAVTDSGSGMDEATRTRAFEPFFTTKEVGRGTGLGLAMVYGFVKSSGGHITVYSEPGHGTSFKIYLPLVSEAPSAGPPAPSSSMPGGSETILLAEDDGDVRAFAVHVLEGLGYTVIAAADGLEAVRRAAQYSGHIHLLITDVVMPQLSGRLCAERILAHRPGLRVLYCSGYTDDAVLRSGVVDAGGALLQKPYVPSALARKVRSMLDGAGPTPRGV